MKTSYLIFLLTIIGSNIDIVSKDTKKILTEKQLKKEINDQKSVLKKYRNELKEIKKNNPLPGVVEKYESRIDALQNSIKNLKSQQRTFNTFFKRKSDVEARAIFDVNHAQDIYAPQFFSQEEPAFEHGDQLGSYFRNH